MEYSESRILQDTKNILYQKLIEKSFHSKLNTSVIYIDVLYD